MTKTQQRQIFLGAAILGVAILAFILMSFWKISTPQSAKLEAPNFVAEALPTDTKKPWPQTAFLNLPLRENSWTLVVFWADWCEPCHAEIPTLQELSQTWSGPALDIVLVNEDDENSEYVASAQKYIADNNIDLKSLWDTNKKIKEQLGIDKIPFHVIVDPTGNIVWQQAGVYDWKSDATKQGLMRLQESRQEKEEMPAGESPQTDIDANTQSQESSPSPQ